MFRVGVLVLLVWLYGCEDIREDDNADSAGNLAEKISVDSDVTSTSIVVLGNIQDAGSPHIACDKVCCKGLFDTPDPKRQVVSLGLFDASNNKRYIIEATPDFPRQIKNLKEFGSQTNRETPDGIFLTHAHIGHYTGLMYLGKEAMDAKSVPVFAMPRMLHFLQNNGPWSQLVTRENIQLKPLENNVPYKLSEELSLTPVLVPHRDEYSETVGYYISGPTKTALFIPDIDKWGRWDRNILEEIKRVDYAFLDATFFSADEVNGRDIAEIPHPFVSESLELFESLKPSDRKKVKFIHFNHTNPIIDQNSEASKMVLAEGFGIARINDIFKL